MTRRLLAGYLSLTVLILLVLAIPLGVTFARAERRHLVDRVQHDALALAMRAQGGPWGDQAALSRLAADYQQATGGRVTIVDKRGGVLADSDPPLPGPRNFTSRPEVAAALRGEEVAGVRHSTTLGRDFVYVAVPVTFGGGVDGAVRITYPMSVVDQRIRRSWLSLASVALFALGIAFAVSMRLARSVGRPLRQLGATAARLGRGELGARAQAKSGPPEVRTLAQVFNLTAARFQRMLESQRAFVADASHQLRTPLAALRLRLENLESEVLPAAREDLDGAIAEVLRLSRLVDGLLTLARAQRGTPTRRALDLHAIVAERHAAWAALADEHKVRLVVVVPAPTPVLASPGHLEQVLDNLLANALEASPAGGTIQIAASLSRTPGLVELHVIDQGVGLSAEQRARAFDRFWRPASAGTGGSGLGLAIVRQLVEADGGAVELRPAPRRGLDAVVRLHSARRLRGPGMHRRALSPTPTTSGRNGLP